MVEGRGPDGGLPSEEFPSYVTEEELTRVSSPRRIRGHSSLSPVDFGLTGRVSTGSRTQSPSSARLRRNKVVGLRSYSV